MLKLFIKAGKIRKTKEDVERDLGLDLTVF